LRHSFISNSFPKSPLTHLQAALSTFPSPTATLTPHTTIADVFTAVQSRSASRGVVPFENSSNGSVVFTLDLLADIHGLHPNLRVCGEAYVAVKHCLLGRASGSPQQFTKEVPVDQKFSNPLAVPKSDLSRIKKLYSHPQAWGQCKLFLATYLKGIERCDVSSTSKAAEIVAQDETGESAALSSAVAADLFGIDLLAESINDHLGNTTRFLVLRHQDEDNIKEEAPSSHGTGHWKSLVTFTLDHGNPGALAKCLAVFERAGINLTSINTRPSGVENWNYVFFVEFQGRKGEEKVESALGELEGVCRECSWKGSWESRS
jgi:prephenate dehydratase